MNKLTVGLCCTVAILFYPIACVITGIWISIEACRNEITKAQQLTRWKEALRKAQEK
jgi:hypothetical protein